jgi:hypothetical protein
MYPVIHTPPAHAALRFSPNYTNSLLFPTLQTSAFSQVLLGQDELLLLTSADAPLMYDFPSILHS